VTGGVHRYRRSWRRLWLRRCAVCRTRTCVLAAVLDEAERRARSDAVLGVDDDWLSRQW
jgi:hypothetical protein